MFKKIMSVMLAVLILMSVVAISASAAQVEIADNSADAVADVAADADGSAETGADNVLNFDANSAGWKNFKKVFCHIWAYGGDSFYAWQQKASACKDADGDGVWTYDLSKVTLEPGVLYAVIFSNENQIQTYNLLFDTNCIGDEAYCDGTEYENPEDSSKTAQAAFWRNQDPATYGPEKCITSIGNVVGTCVPSTTSSQAMFEHFLTETLENARTYAKNDDGSAKTDQQILDDTAAQLDLKQENVADAIAATGAKVEWDAKNSTLPTGKNEDANKTPSGGTAGGDNSGSSNSGSSNNGSSNGGSSNSGSSSSGGKTGSGSTTKTGFETTAIFVMLGVMIAAAGVVVIARRKENA